MPSAAGFQARMLDESSLKTRKPKSPPKSGFSAFTFAGDNFNLGIRLLQQFGNVQVLSSPKAMVLNNQTAVLKVVDNQVFFTIEADTTQNTNQTTTTVTTTLESSWAVLVQVTLIE